MTEIEDRERETWLHLLHACWMFHQQMVRETAPVILGDAGADDHIFHKAASVAIMDAINLIQEMEAMGYFEEIEDEISTAGPAG